MAEPIPYMTPEPRQRWRRIGKIAAITIGVLLLLQVLLSSGDHIENGWICAICASDRRDTEWAIGFTTGKSLTLSALDTWMSQNAIVHTHDWRHIRGARKDIFGLNRGSAHGSAPPIYSIPRTLLPVYVNAASPQQLKEFVQTMMTGTEDEQKRAVDAACDLALEAPGKAR